MGPVKTKIYKCKQREFGTDSYFFDFILFLNYNSYYVVINLYPPSKLKIQKLPHEEGD